MKFGDPNQFGIEFDLDEKPEGVWMLGHVCYWICGKRIGDYEQTVSLRDVLFRWSEIAGDADKRTNDYLMALDKVDLANLLSHTLFGTRPVDPVNQSRAMEEQWARHVIEPVIIYGFEGWHIFLVEAASFARCIYYWTKTEQYYECHLEYGEFDKVLCLAIQSLEEHLSNSV